MYKFTATVIEFWKERKWKRTRKIAEIEINVSSHIRQKKKIKFERISIKKGQN